MNALAETPTGPDEPAPARRRQASTLIGAVADAARAEAQRRGLPPTEITRLVRRRLTAGRDGTARAHQTAAERRERVLRYPDLARRLVEVLQLKNPAAWSGYVPPRTDGNNQLNTSPRRRALVEICTEALRREQAEAQDEVVDAATEDRTLVPTGDAE